MTDVYHHIQDSLLTLHRSHGINLVERILLQDNEVYQLGLPEDYVILYRYTVITQDIDLLGNLLTALQASFDFVHLTDPLIIDMLGNVCFKFRIFDILGIRIDRIYSRITLLIGTILLQSIETTGYLLGVLCHRLLQVTTGR